MGLIRGIIFSVAAGVLLAYLGFPQFLVGIVVVFLIARNVFSDAGGYPEALYRARGIDYYQFYIFAPNRRIIRPIVKASDVKVGSAARFQCKITSDKSGDYMLPSRDDAEAWFANPHGAPAAEYNWDDARPIRVFGTEPDAVMADGVRVPKAKVDPFLLHKAYVNDLLERRAKANIKEPRIPRVTLLLSIATVMFMLFLIGYTLYFGNNISCAVHAKSCP